MSKWNTPDDLKYSESDEWFRVTGDIVTLGITDYAQNQLSDVVYVELPEVGTQFSAGDSYAVVESVKAASDVYTVVGGEVVEVNSVLEDEPEKVNEDPYSAGWFIKIKTADSSPVDKLMDSKTYAEFCQNRDDH
jgi:glycine cleavage system H protein